MVYKLIRLCLGFAMVALLATQIQANTRVEWQIQNTLKTAEPPLDVAVAPNGQSIFVLTAGGNILIYDGEGQLLDTINVGSHIDQIRVGPGGEHLFATSRKNQTVEVIALNFIRRVNIAGSPARGPKDAPVVLTVFSDFQ